jgi:hypothetical protein
LAVFHWVRAVEGIGLVIVRATDILILVIKLVSGQTTVGVSYPLATPRGVSEEVAFVGVIKGLGLISEYAGNLGASPTVTAPVGR